MIVPVAGFTAALADQAHIRIVAPHADGWRPDFELSV